MPVDTRINIDPEDSDAMLEALRELAQAVQSFESRMTILETQVANLASDVRDIEDKTASK